MRIYQSLNWSAFRGYEKASLPLISWANAKSWVMLALFENCYSCPADKNYCKQNNLTFKVVLVLDNAPDHLTVLNGLCKM
jgi:hypothetical protein